MCVYLCVYHVCMYDIQHLHLCICECMSVMCVSKWHKCEYGCVHVCMQVGIEGIQMCIMCMLCFSVFVIWRALVYICLCYVYVCICLYGMQYVGICVRKLCACVYCGQYVLYNIHMIVC